MRQFLFQLGDQPDPNRDAVEWTDGTGVRRSVSYPAVKNYHSLVKPTEPPVWYLERVAEVYGEDLAELVRGSDAAPKSKGANAYADGLDDGLSKHLPLSHLSAFARQAIERASAVAAARVEPLVRGRGLSDAQFRAHVRKHARSIGERVGMSIAEPLRQLDIEPIQGLRPAVLESYILLACEALVRLSEAA
jgi:hypothetical protein